MICAIVLAAGRSERMGRQKLLLPIAGSTVVSRVVDAYLAAPVDAICVVLSQANRDIPKALGKRPLRYVINKDPAGDMLSSVRCGLRSLPVGAKAIFVSPGDQPSLEPMLIRQMLEIFAKTKKRIVVPKCRGQRGHPLLFDNCYRQEILNSFDTVGLRGLLAAHSDEVCEWDTINPLVLEDMDTPADYARIAGQGKMKGISSLPAG